MKIAVLSDIHGNIDALEAVLADAARRGVDEIVNLGDICSGGLFPPETADRLIALDIPTIRGNHERQVLTHDAEKLGLSDRYALTTLRPEHLAWFETLPKTLWLRNDVLLVHGTPTSDVEYWLETVTEQGIRPATQDEIIGRAGTASASLILCGHTHIPRVAWLPNGQLIVNPGSVGLPAYDDDRPFPHVVETGSPHARYAIVDDSTGQWAAELINVDYDWETAAVVAANNGRDDWARALRTGRV
jgi:predicted phosphodiesterase